MIYADAREKSKLFERVKKTLEPEIKYLDAGDYWIVGEQGKLVIEVTTMSDFCGKMVSGRLWEQVQKCVAETDADHAYMLVVGRYPTVRKYITISRKQVLGAISSVSRQMKVLWVDNFSEAYDVLDYFHRHCDTVSEHTSRTKIKSKNPQEVAEWCMAGCTGIGPSTASKLLEYHSIADLGDMGEDEIAEIIGPKKAKSLYEVLRA